MEDKELLLKSLELAISKKYATPNISNPKGSIHFDGFSLKPILRWRTTYFLIFPYQTIQLAGAIISFESLSAKLSKKEYQEIYNKLLSLNKEQKELDKEYKKQMNRIHLTQKLESNGK